MAMASRAYNGGDNQRAHELARQYGTEFVGLNGFRTMRRKQKKAPIELIVRHNFVPLEETQDGKVAVADPGQLLMLDRTKLALNRGIVTKVSTLRRMSEILTRTEPSQRDEYR
jgi:Type II secretion system (T2SS), protein E, N-terminal domain